VTQLLLKVTLISFLLHPPDYQEMPYSTGEKEHCPFNKYFQNIVEIVNGRKGKQ